MYVHMYICTSLALSESTSVWLSLNLYLLRSSARHCPPGHWPPPERLFVLLHCLSVLRRGDTCHQCPRIVHPYTHLRVPKALQFEDRQREETNTPHSLCLSVPPHSGVAVEPFSHRQVRRRPARRGGPG